jgi:hypothetical protein
MDIDPYEKYLLIKDTPNLKAEDLGNLWIELNDNSPEKKEIKEHYFRLKNKKIY